MNDKIYKHYGASHLNPGIEYPPPEYYTSRLGCYEHKPFGLWGCAENVHKLDWHFWCLKNRYNVNRLKDWFTFRLKDDANILTINNVDIFVRDPNLITTYINDNATMDYEDLYKLNIEYIVSHYDGIELFIDESSCPAIYDEVFSTNRYLFFTLYPCLNLPSELLGGTEIKRVVDRIHDYYTDDEYEKLKRCFGLFALWDVESLCVWNLNVIDEVASSDQKVD